MRIFDYIRGHFALLTGRKISTVAGRASFVIERVHSLENPASGWLMEIKITSSGESYQLYLSDILTVYTEIINNYWSESGSKWVALADVKRLLSKSGVDDFKSSYIMALLATFDDIKTRKGPKPAIRYIPFQEQFDEYHVVE